MIESMLEPHLKEAAGASQVCYLSDKQIECNNIWLNLFLACDLDFKTNFDLYTIGSGTLCIAILLCKIHFWCRKPIKTLSSDFLSFFKPQMNFFQMEVGVTFLILGGCYMASTPIVGFVRSFLYLNTSWTIHEFVQRVLSELMLY